MTIFALINEARSRGISLSEENGHLRLRSPRGALTDDIRGQILANKDDLVAFLRQLSGRRKIPPIVPVDRSDLNSRHLSLSFAQERLWFIDQLEPGSAGYNIPAAVMIRGELDVGYLEQAFNLVIARHENLRTIFPSEEGRAQQLILDSLDFRLQIVDLSDESSGEARDREARRFCQAEARTPFDLVSGPLIRGKVIKLSPQEHVLMLNMHHIVSDGWSIEVLVRELGLIMNALRQGRDAALAPLPVQYLDYSIWQRNWLEQGGVLEKELDYWHEKLADVPECINLATDYPRPGVQSFAGATWRFTLDTQLTGQLKRLAERQGGTLFMTLLAAFKVLLYRYTGQEDICVGSPVANRQHEETENLIGLFVNTLALRSRLDGEDTFTSLLEKVKATCLEAYEYQDTPFEKVVDRVRPQRNMSISPLFQVMVILQNADVEAPEQNIQPYVLDSGISKFDLTAEFTETREGVSGSIEYSTALYKKETIERMAGHFVALCRAVTSRPTTRISDLDYMEEIEKRQLLIEYNRTQADYPKDKCLHELFLEQVAINPDKTAIVYEGEKLSYQQLYDKSQVLALYLQSLGVNPDGLVGLCVERSLDMIVGMLGILRAGGAYVPLDPEYPEERLSYMLQDGRAEIVVTQENLRDKLAVLVAEHTQLVTLDGQWSEITDRVAELEAGKVELREEVKPHHLAYVIYTSGSTGRPKGVAIEHHSPVTLVHWASDMYSREELSGVLASTSICFDLHVYEIFLTLSNGGEIILAPDALGLVDLANKESITLINTVPSTMEELIRLKAIPDSVQTINLAGEPLLPALVDKIHANSSVQKVYDLYGPSEDTTYTTFALRERGAPQTIGRPIANTQIYIVDQHNSPQPIGVPGELHIAGDGLARGYLNHDDLTREKFIPNPFNPGTRMYRTGDLARWSTDGNIEYLGRIDTQVKLRGFRIETGEIESQLNRHPDIRDNIVVPRGDDANKQLIAFYVADNTEEDEVIELSDADLRAHLQQVLPEYMVPAAFVSLEAIPHTPNGKVDRLALGRMDVDLKSSQAYLAPRNDTEERLVTIWSQVLNIPPEKIGVNDNFFELGGHSLLAVRLMAKINSQFNQSLPLASLFAAQDVAALAQAISSKREQFDLLVPVQTRGIMRPIFAVPGAGGNVLSLQPLSRALGTNRPFYGLHAIGLDGKSQPFDSIEKTAETNIVAMQTVQSEGPYNLLGHSYGGVVAYEMAKALTSRGERIASLILLDCLAPSLWQQQEHSDDLTMLYEVSVALAGMYGTDLGLNKDHLRRVKSGDRVACICDLLNRRLDLDMTAAQFNAFYEAFRANDRCYRSYRPSRLSQEMEVYLFRANEKGQDTSQAPDHYGWSELFSSTIRTFDVNGSHFSMLHTENVDDVVRRLDI